MNAHFAAWRQKSASVAEGTEGWLPSEASDRRARGEPARPLRRQAAHRPLRHLSAPDGLLGGDDAGRLLPDRRRRLEGRDLSHHREGQEGQGEGQGLGLRPGSQALIVARYFAKEQAAIDQLAAELESVSAKITELEEEHGGEDGAFSELDKVNKVSVAARLKEIKDDKEAKDEAAALNEWLKLNGEESGSQETAQGGRGRPRRQGLCALSQAHRGRDQALVVDDKWLAALDAAIHGEMDRVSQQLTQRVKELAERYETPLPK